MDRRVKNAIFIICGGALIGVLFLYFWKKPIADTLSLETTQAEQNEVVVLQTNKVVYDAIIEGENISFPVTIVDTEEKREHGLSNTDSLPSKTGELFIFETPGNYGFWMKDMNYPLDMVWIDKNLKIIGVTRNISPSTYPDIFYPPKAVQYVIEVNANEAEALGLKVGKNITIKK
jgi:uncharacterized protein